MDIAITFDMDHISCNNQLYEINNISFNYDNALNKLYDLLSKKNIKHFTVFVRIDKQIKNIFGNYLYVLNKIPKSNLKPEIGWHPHFYTKTDCYHQQTNSNYIIKELFEVYNDNPIIKNMRCVRMGGSVMNKDIMSTLNIMNFYIDSSAMPGCVRNDKYRQFDWSHCGNSTYYPSLHDYQCNGNPHHRIMEIPMTTIIIQAPYDKKINRRYINPTIKKEIFQPAFSAYCQFLPHIVITFHPDQLMDGYQDDLYKYGISNFMENMEFIEETLIDIKYKSLSQLYAK